ncbi:uncharacterized protein EDB91DRAFT_1248642 [Suillus paluster]|uniref:uncharacterized protein n=1 Tax=Suillus paluster TaxID=48578 RepID=UPI001B877FB0|nr:uncharacterized protein EDB91DRAFT_1248642 [Suillus paluster]KAG1739881.1 hypothetical protein EDB91DRAFT_1248642 [Suillus paluster]
MQFLQFAIAAVFAAVAVQASSFTCENKAVISSSFIGENSDVKVETLGCSNTIQKRGLEARQTNVCADTCTTNCFTPSGGGPDPYDCQVISDALLYDSQNIGALFNITTATTLYMQYATCETFFVNQASYTETYCRTNWANVVEYVAFNCQSQQNAHGGNCVTSDQTWFIQVQTVA